MEGDSFEKAQRFIHRGTNVLTLGALTAVLTLSATGTESMDIAPPTTPSTEKSTSNEK